MITARILQAFAQKKLTSEQICWGTSIQFPSYKVDSMSALTYSQNLHSTCMKSQIQYNKVKIIYDTEGQKVTEDKKTSENPLDCVRDQFLWLLPSLGGEATYFIEMRDVK